MQPSQPATWNQAAQQLWQQSDQQGAIDLLLQAINADLAAVPKALGLQLAYYVFLLGDLPSAEQFLQRLAAIHPDDGDILEILAVVISRQLQRAADALPLFEQVCTLRPESANAWDGPASALSRTDQRQRAQQAGERALALKTAAATPLLARRPAQCPAHSRALSGLAVGLPRFCGQVSGLHG